MLGDNAARIEFESAVDQCKSDIDVLAKICKHSGRIGKRRGIIVCNLKGSPSELHGFVAVLCFVIGPSIDREMQAPPRG